MEQKRLWVISQELNFQKLFRLLPSCSYFSLHSTGTDAEPPVFWQEFSHRAVISREDLVFSSLHKHYLRLNPYWEQDDSRWALYLQGNSDNTIFQTSTFLGDLIFEQTAPVTVLVGEILKSLKNFALEIFVFEVTEVYTGLEETYSFLQFSAGLLSRLIPSSIL